VLQNIGVMIIGSKGAVATTLIAAWATAKVGLSEHFALPTDADPLFQKLQLKSFDQMIFSGWDLSNESYSKSLHTHRVVPSDSIQKISALVDSLPFFPAIVGLDNCITEKIGANAHPITTRQGSLAEQVDFIRQDIQHFRSSQKVDKVIIVNLASTDRLYPKTETHQSVERFAQAVQDSSETLSPGMLYAYAGILECCHLINFTPSDFFEIPALIELAKDNQLALAGRDGKTGQTLYKTVLAPMFKLRGLKVDGWYSTNILGNRDGAVLHEEGNKESKIFSKKEVLRKILGYDDFDHQVHIHYYAPRGDAKEAWDNIDFSGWFGTKMQMKIDWLGVDSILAAPLVLDLIRWMDFFSDKGENGILTQLSVYFKQPIATDECDFFKQYATLCNHISSNYS
jgi:myo-inositol-1-phosphate synthase